MKPAEFDALLDSQGGRCAICRTETAGGKGGWHVDHDHATGRIRGLLCHGCNIALGYFRDDPDRLRAAMAYLETAREARDNGPRRPAAPSLGRPGEGSSARPPGSTAPARAWTATYRASRGPRHHRYR